MPLWDVGDTRDSLAHYSTVPAAWVFLNLGKLSLESTGRGRMKKQRKKQNIEFNSRVSGWNEDMENPARVQPSTGRKVRVG